MYATLHRFFAIASILMIVSIYSPISHGHEIRPAVVDMTIADDGQYQLLVRLNLEAIMSEIEPEHTDTSESVNAEQYNQLRALSSAALNQSFRDFQQTFLDGLYLNADGVKLNPVVKQVSIPDTGDIELARDSTITLQGTIAANTQTITWGWHTLFGANAVRVSTSEQTDIHAEYLQAGKISSNISLNDAVVQTGWQIFSNYLVVGFEHIIPKGLDHILFVVGLFLLSLKLSTLLWQITSFTIAHSVTLALAILGYVSVSPEIVEPLIALSIVYVCVENMLSDTLHKWRPILIFSFGLLHGLGFASVLTEIGLSSNHFINSLIAFNIGLELGQLAVIAVCFFGVAVWIKHKPWYRQRITIPASGLIAIIGGYWFVERTFF